MFFLYVCKQAFCKLSQQTFVDLEDVFNTSSAQQLTSSKTSWRHLARRLQNVFKTSWKTKNCYVEDVLKTCLEDVSKICLEDVLKTCLEDILKILWRQTKYLLGISVYLSGDNKSKCVSNKSIVHKSLSDNSKANPKCIN